MLLEPLKKALLYFFVVAASTITIISAGWVILQLVDAARPTYERADSAGWIPHQRLTLVHYSGEWLQDEMRACMMLKIDPATGQSSADFPGALSANELLLDCDGFNPGPNTVGPEHARAVQPQRHGALPGQRRAVPGELANVRLELQARG